MCAYNPQVQDRSGELLAQGISSAADSVAQGMQAYQQNKLRNQAIQGENDALLKLFAQDPDLKKYAPEGLEKFVERSVKGGGLSLKDNVQLNGMLNTTLKTKGVIQEQAMQRQQQEMNKKAMEMQQIQMAELQRKNAILQEQQAQLEKLKQFSNLSRTNGVLKADVQDGMTKEMQTNPFLQAQMQAMRAGGAMAPDTLAQYVAATGRQGGVDYEKYREDGADGKTYEVTVDKRTGKPVAKGTIHQPPAAPDVPDPLVRDVFNDFAKDRTERVQPALDAIRSNREIEKLLNTEDGKIISGAFAKPELLFKRAANALGADYKEVATTQQLGAHVAKNVANIIKAFGSGTGLSDADREYAMKAAGGDITMDEKAIKEIIRINAIAAKNVPKTYNKSLDKAFPKDSTNKAYNLARARLELNEDENDDTPSPAPTPAPTSAAKSILEKYGIK
jgi:hypothetical protein